MFEKFYDMTLFRRQGRELRLIHAGKILFEKAERLFSIEDEVESTLAEIKELNQGLLEIGCTKAYANHIMPSVI